jgi:hypothetical protein
MDSTPGGTSSKERNTAASKERNTAAQKEKAGVQIGLLQETLYSHFTIGVS